MTQTPTIGRIVCVPMKPSENNGSDIAPAMVTRVWSNDVINVRVIGDSTSFPWRTSVKRVDNYDPDQPHTWWWPVIPERKDS